MISSGSGERRVLVLEDEFLIALEMEHLIESCGCVVVGPVSSVGGGIAAVQQTELDGAVLDINIRDERVWPVAELLDHRGIPFVFTSGYELSEIPAQFRDRPLLRKPLMLKGLRLALDSIGLTGC